MPPMYWSTGMKCRAARVERALGVPRVAEAQEVPRGVDEGVHGVGLAPGRAPHTGHVVCRKPSWERERRLPGREELDVVGRETGSWSSGTGTMPWSGQ